MKAALLYGRNDLRVVEIGKPEIGSNDILAKVKACAVCPTDVRKYRTGNHGVTGFPMNLGHEWTGDVAEVGERVKGFGRGMRIIGGGYAGYAEYAKVPSQRLELGTVFEVPGNVSYEEGTFAEPLADCIHAVKEQAEAKAGDTVAIIGAGPMGLQLLMVAKWIGATAIVSEVLEKRREYAEKFGADFLINPTEEDPVEAVKKMTRGEGADSVIVSIGHPTAIRQGLGMVKKRGRVVLFGGAPEGTIVELDPNIIHYGEILLTGSYWVGVRPYHNVELYKKAVDLISSQKVPVNKLITHRFALDEIHEAFRVQESGEGLKAVIIPP